MRLRFTAEMIDDNGERVSKPVEIETSVPNPEKYGDKSCFYIQIPDMFVEFFQMRQKFPHHPPLERRHNSPHIFNQLFF
ncbi:MAG: hypothetical protein IJQ81_07970 [Oscillibacter sp.]|nr:hypothetical protein [Oscillibacter sp.]